MRDLTDKISRYYKYFKSRCKCGEKCFCEKAATVWAHVDSVIPEEYRNYTIDDFQGLVKEKEIKKRVLPEDVVAAARQKVIDYCWGEIEEGLPYDADVWLKKSKMGQRHRDASTIVIYGQRWLVSTNESGQRRVTKKACSGKTMLASIVMKAAIFHRYVENRMSDTYAWVDYNTLTDRLMSHANKEKDFTDEINFWRDADWLVVDKIAVAERANENARQFRASVLDHFFCDRKEQHLPNILVFQDDISKMDELESDFGGVIDSIVNSQKTFRVCLASDGK